MVIGVSYREYVGCSKNADTSAPLTWHIWCPQRTLTCPWPKIWYMDAMNCMLEIIPHKTIYVCIIKHWNRQKNKYDQSCKKQNKAKNKQKHFTPHMFVVCFICIESRSCNICICSIQVSILMRSFCKKFPVSSRMRFIKFYSMSFTAL